MNEPTALETLAALIAGNMIGSAGYRPGVFVRSDEAAGDALAIAAEIIKQAGEVQTRLNREMGIL